MSERIQKLLATAGIASRRAVETMIAEGRVTVNGRPAEAGQRIDHNDHVRVDSRLVSLSRKAEPARVLLYRKRVGELVTRDDPEGRKTVFRKLPELSSGRWIAIGRLDINTSGLLLLTNDGELARRLMHPSFEMRREYAVRVLGTIDDAVLQRLRTGVTLEDGFAKFETIVAGANETDDDDSANRWWTVTVKQGRNRVVRRLFESQNLQVSRLMRVAYGPITLGRGIKSGSCREATAEELQALLEAVDMADEAKAVRATSKKAAAPRRKPMPEADARPQPPLRRRSPRAAAEAERKREFFDRGDDGAGAARKPSSRPGRSSDSPIERRREAAAGPRAASRAEPRRAARDDARPESRSSRRPDAGAGAGYRSDASAPRKSGPRADARSEPRRAARDDARPESRSARRPDAGAGAGYRSEASAPRKSGPRADARGAKPAGARGADRGDGQRASPRAGSRTDARPASGSPRAAAPGGKPRRDGASRAADARPSTRSAPASAPRSAKPDAGRGPRRSDGPAKPSKPAARKGPPRRK
ncbi:S4 domain-containing protein [Hydrocarboniphaga daqingensis]|uniref:Pseudouridine synthase n=1 Tax=Hydrocarboniphaga daqingensis TaxID=490188 RepID=A0A1M5PYF4_9GAMM|nr:pseudouridine synthase [Hydrocarboniphaga daqingensis]SHH06489.1 S4 domain-containing protein [Hydrocarboniphaga daqingensis]